MKFLSLGMHPPSNSFLRADQIEAEKRYPLEVYFCETCSLVQLIDVVPAETIFNDYVYLSSSSKALKNHYSRLTDSISTRFGLKAGDVVVDVGCNDGILLQGYSSMNVIKVGVEPSKVAEIAAASGLNVVRAFFETSTAQRILDMYGEARVVTATNVFAHVDDIGAFIEGLVTLLRDDGILVVETPYLIDLIDQVLFDTIYHEHLCYLSLTPMAVFLSRYDLEVFDVERIPFGASGPAFRVFVGKKGRQPVEPTVTQMLLDENRWGVGDATRYFGYTSKVETIKVELLGLVERLRASGARIGGYGAPAKGNTLLNYFGFTPTMVECIAETNRLKQGLLTPGSHIPIVSEDEFLQWNPEYALLLSWNYLDFFLKESKYVRKGGRFIVPIPWPRIILPNM